MDGWSALPHLDAEGTGQFGVADGVSQVSERQLEVNTLRIRPSERSQVWTRWMRVATSAP